MQSRLSLIAQHIVKQRVGKFEEVVDHNPGMGVSHRCLTLIDQE